MKCQSIPGLEHPAETQGLFTMKNMKPLWKANPHCLEYEARSFFLP